MRAAAIGLVAGASLLQQQSALLSWYWLLLLLAPAVGALCCAGRWIATRRVLLLAGGTLAGFCWAGLIAHWHLRETLPADWEGRDLTLIGTIASLPQPVERGVRFHFAVERQVSVPESEAAIPKRLALSWHAGDEEELPRLAPGERWQLTVRLRQPHGNANPHGFDHEVWMLERGLRASGYVRPDRKNALKNSRLDDFVPGAANLVERSRGWLRERIEQALAGRPYAGVIVALVIGEQRAISQSDWEIFNRSGIGHLISISGLHITMIAGLAAAAFGALWRRSFFTDAQLPLRLPAQKAAAAAGLMTALLYVLLAGFGVPAQRTLYMLAVVTAALWLGRLTNVSAVLCGAVAIVVLLDPWAVLWPGFWLSFCAVAIILYCTVGRVPEPPADESTPRARLMPVLRAAARTQYAITIGLVPLTMLLFGQISLISPIANAVAIPLVSLLVTPLALAGSVAPGPLCDGLLLMAHAGIAGLAWMLGGLSALPGAVWGMPLPSTAAFLAALAGTLWLLAPPGWPQRWLGLVWLLPLALTAPSRPNPGELWVTAFDVGQGTAVLIETHEHRMLYDTGPAYSEDGDGGNRVILPYLKARGIDRLDLMMVSHSDNDHAGGALSLLKALEVERVSSSMPHDHEIARRARRHERCEQGRSWSWDEAHFDLLYPSPEQYERKKAKPNHRSCTLRIRLGEHVILLPGDIESAQEAELVRTMGDDLRATVLFAPHHGSGTSSTPPFLEAVRPALAIFQIGYRNRYRHPKEEVYRRYGEFGIRRLRTDASGAITLRFGREMQVAEYRATDARYWHKRQPRSDGAAPAVQAPAD
ncbi:DNA internalization-related competence protein ComEC/Rec2 [Noviherbaspirillum aridicola]|uniref:DNA internalization-related competence protein ComEC/Rec2 n=1 Tax=Noviherbaspirillum aridicola TaxID=2849687 RepID=A0ABQ4Q9T2_9BURK|nr:DNA internalization-related competence protein ComEC/Rec2 [Noviherbaspirillum aridicola]